MKIGNIQDVYKLCGAIISAERNIVELEKDFKPGVGNVPSASFGYDQSGANEIEGVAGAREKLKKAIAAAFKEYRKDLIKVLGKYQ